MTDLSSTSELRRAATAVYLATTEDIAQSISKLLINAAKTIDELQDLIIWMTGCGYDFFEHPYFCEKYKLVKGKPGESEVNKNINIVSKYEILTDMCKSMTSKLETLEARYIKLDEDLNTLQYGSTEEV